MPGNPSRPDLEDVLRAYVDASTAKLETIHAAVANVNQKVDLHVNDDKHVHARLDERIDAIEDKQEVTGNHELADLREKARKLEEEKKAQRDKIIDWTLKALGAIALLVVGWLSRHFFWK